MGGESDSDTDSNSLMGPEADLPTSRELRLLIDQDMANVMGGGPGIMILPDWADFAEYRAFIIHRHHNWRDTDYCDVSFDTENESLGLFMARIFADSLKDLLALRITWERQRSENVPKMALSPSGQLTVYDCRFPRRQEEVEDWFIRQFRWLGQMEDQLMEERAQWSRNRVIIATESPASMFLFSRRSIHLPQPGND